jgi:hypothetical protein
VSQVVGYIKGKSAIHLARVYAGQKTERMIASEHRRFLPARAVSREERNTFDRILAHGFLVDLDADSGLL